jgi:hypothetical protein
VQAEVKPEVTKENKMFTMEEMETLVKEETDRVTQNVCTSCVQQGRNLQKVIQKKSDVKKYWSH